MQAVSPALARFAPVSARRSASARCAAPGASSRLTPRRGVAAAHHPRRLAAASEPPTAASDADAALPRRCRDAIDLGLLAYSEKDYEAAADLFQLALTLPGNGTARLSGSPKEYAVPSAGEENSAIYNLACVYCATGRSAEALECVTAVLNNGFDDVQALRSDPDLAPIRDGVAKLLAERDAPLAKLARLAGSLRSSDGVPRNSGSRPWLRW